MFTKLAEAGRTEYDSKRWTLTHEGCDGEECAKFTGTTRVTVQNSHWKDFHATPPRKNIFDHKSHGSSLRNIIVTSKTIRSAKFKCDGTKCSGSGSS